MNPLTRIARSVCLKTNSHAFSSTITKATPKAPVRREHLQFSKARLVDFGELPHGEIPQALKYSRPSSINKLSNAVRVVTESWKGSHTAITVAVKTGSRQESLSSSSVAQFAARSGLQGTATHSKEQIEDLIDSLGGNIEVNVGREITQFSLFFPRQNLDQAVALLSEIVLKPNLDTVNVESQKAAIFKNASSMDPHKVSLENVHYTAYRDHFMGQPSTGIRDNVYSITPEQVHAYHSQFYVGENIVVSAAGEVDAARFTDLVNTHFGKVSSSVEQGVENKEQPLFTPSLMFQRDDEIYNTSVAVGFKAPSWNDPDFFAMQFFKRLIGEYRCDKYTGAHLNVPHLQYNQFHTYLGGYPDIILQKPFYLPYSDTGLFGNFLFGNEIFNREMLLMSQNMLSTYAQVLNQAEVFRARNKFFNDLLEHSNPVKVARRNSHQAAYLDRLISRTEAATRISHMDPAYVKKVATDWFWDKELAIVAWGNLHNVMNHAHYHRPYRRSTLGEYAYVDVHHGN